MRSPFSDSNISSRPGTRKKQSLLTPIAVTVIALVLIGVGVRWLSWLNDPLRTLTPFPVEAYFQNPQSLLGSHFRADLTVEADLGWKEGTGKLMEFYTKDSEARPFAALVPETLSSIYFEKGQTYRAQLTVKDGGLVVLESCRRD